MSKQAGKYFASVLVDTTDYKGYSQNRSPSVGVDFGVKSLAVTSDKAQRLQPSSDSQAAVSQIALSDSYRGSQCLVRNRKLARSIADAGFGMLRQLIEYKATLRGCTVERVDRFFPSSRMCSGYGQRHDITLAASVLTA